MQYEARVTDLTRAQLHWAQQGIVALSKVEPPWHERLSGLARHPHLVLESLLMSQQFDPARKLLQSLPGLHDDDMLLHYARLDIMGGNIICCFHQCMEFDHTNEEHLPSVHFRHLISRARKSR